MVRTMILEEMRKDALEYYGEEEVSRTTISLVFLGTSLSTD
jgi:hypothetical protein